MTMRTWNLRAGLVVLAWLIALLGVTISGNSLAGGHWLMIHLLGLGAASNAILIWSWYFTEAVLRLSHTEQRVQHAVRLIAFNIGAVTVVVSYGIIGAQRGEVSHALWYAIVAGATVAFAAIAWHSASLFQRVRTALPSRFGPMV
ncbi:MAG: copper oxidase, partial [Gordonia sp. (in: high G+C Gram-positive bacteria)]